MPDDSAVIALESNETFFVQYALFFEAGHPFLNKTLEYIFDNIKKNRYPHDVHKMTGPSAYTKAINDCIYDVTGVKYRQLGAEYDSNVKFSYPLSKPFLYGFSRKNHWKNQSKLRPILKDEKDLEKL